MLRARSFGVVLALSGLGVPAAVAQSVGPAALQYTARIEYDSFFGLYPTLSLARSLDSLRTLTGYATYYAQPGSAGLDLGASLRVAGLWRGLTLAPAVGLLSGGFFGPGRGFLVGEGYTASLAVEKTGPRITVGALLGYYGLLRQKTPDVYDIAFYHVEAGYQVSRRLTVGALHEQILAVRRAHNEGDSATFGLARVGAFGRGELPGGVQVELATGWLAGGFVRASVSRALGRARP